MHRPEELTIYSRNDYIQLTHPAGLLINGTFTHGSGPQIIKQISIQLDISRTYSTSLSALPSSLTSLLQLKTDEDTLQYFNDDIGGRIFPSLRFLKLTPLSAKSVNDLEHLWEFLNQQLCGGSPVSVLDLTRLRPLQVYGIAVNYMESRVGLAKMRWVLPQRVPMSLGQLEESGRLDAFRSRKADLLRQETQSVDIDEAAVVFSFDIMSKDIMIWDC
ncbi:hypothetical protein JR316_0012832 [Psilocybe cubensis]|uniref:Uncharacterized protein n=2 Tax=Psilocybe cubensis TaxID=181762 RepID=A0ACB8GFX9_PSICU|nr:hypothetical protein JR316_0012832 [Psilocybe cubensis]KAH9474374.1 hypothetical protein JR316_0012832 [Psilocybe cubensis]